MSEDHLPAVIRPPAPIIELRRELERSERYAASALAPSTRRAYERDWREFASWCAAHALRPLPAESATVSAFLASEADRELRPVTRRRDRCSAPRPGSPEPLRLGRRHRGHGRSSPRARHPPASQGGAARARPAAAAHRADRSGQLAGRRDRALLLVGFAAALRRSELVALDVSDLEFNPARGLLLTIRKSKTDQEQAGAQVDIPYAPGRQ